MLLLSVRSWMMSARFSTGSLFTVPMLTVGYDS